MTEHLLKAMCNPNIMAAIVNSYLMMVCIMQISIENHYQSQTKAATGGTRVKIWDKSKIAIWTSSRENLILLYANN